MGDKKLSLESFNNILCNCGLDRLELLMHEIEMAYCVKIEKNGRTGEDLE